METKESVALNDWVRGRYPSVWSRMTHVPSERKNKFEAIVVALMGAKPGVFDFWFGEPRGEYHGFWLELKATGRTWSDVSKAQRDFGDLQAAAGYFTAIGYGLDHAMAIITDYLEEPQHEIEHHRHGVIVSARKWLEWEAAA